MVRCCRVQSFITTCLNIVMAEDSNFGVDSGSEHSIAFKVDGCGHPRVLSVPPKFCSATIKLAALQIHLLGVKNYQTVAVHYFDPLWAH